MKKIELQMLLYTFNMFHGSNVLLTLKIMDFQNVALTKVVHIYVIHNMNAYMI
jgi:hypothetical protein